MEFHASGGRSRRSNPPREIQASLTDVERVLRDA
jgi:hypothetical protein